MQSYAIHMVAMISIVTFIMKHRSVKLVLSLQASPILTTSIHIGKALGPRSYNKYIYQSNCISVYLHICIRISNVSDTLLASDGKACVQNRVSGSYMDAVFKFVENEDSEIWTCLPHSFTKEGLLQLPRLEFV